MNLVRNVEQIGVLVVGGMLSIASAVDETDGAFAVAPYDDLRSGYPHGLYNRSQFCSEYGLV